MPKYSTDTSLQSVVPKYSISHPCSSVIFFFSLLCSNISEMRQSYKDAFLKKHNIKLGFMSAFVKAAAYALADQPAVNAGTHLTAVHFLSTLGHSFTAALWCV